MELKRFSCWFVLAAVLGANSTATADVLPPPPPPPPGVNPAPTTPPPSGTLEAPPPPPPGVNIDPPPQTPPQNPPPSPPEKPAPTKTEAPPSKPIEGVPPPPPPPEGVKTPVRQPKPPVAEEPRQTKELTRREKILAQYKSPASPEKDSPHKYAGWYGWKSLIGLAPVHALFIAGAASDTEALYIPAVVGGAILTPIMHRAHDNKGRGWVSFGVNVATMYIGYGIGEGYGASVALGIWNAVDVLVMHHEDAPPTAKAPTPPTSFAVVPVMRPDYKGLSVVGQF